MSSVAWTCSRVGRVSSVHSPSSRPEEFLVRARMRVATSAGVASGVTGGTLISAPAPGPLRGGPVGEFERRDGRVRSGVQRLADRDTEPDVAPERGEVVLEAVGDDRAGVVLQDRFGAHVE